MINIPTGQDNLQYGWQGQRLVIYRALQDADHNFYDISLSGPPINKQSLSPCTIQQIQLITFANIQAVFAAWQDVPLTQIGLIYEQSGSVTVLAAKAGKTALDVLTKGQVSDDDKRLDGSLFSWKPTESQTKPVTVQEGMTLLHDLIYTKSIQRCLAPPPRPADPPLALPLKPASSEPYVQPSSTPMAPRRPPEVYPCNLLPGEYQFLNGKYEEWRRGKTGWENVEFDELLLHTEEKKLEIIQLIQTTPDALNSLKDLLNAKADEFTNICAQNDPSIEEWMGKIIIPKAKVRYCKGQLRPVMKALDYWISQLS